LGVAALHQSPDERDDDFWLDPLPCRRPDDPSDFCRPEDF
jgi:hypothetical protein